MTLKIKSLISTLAFIATVVLSVEAQPTTPQITSTLKFGGNGHETLNQIEADGDGNIYVAGNTRSTTMQVYGGYDTHYNGGTNSFYQEGDGFVAKFNARMELVWSTFVGGDSYDACTDIAIDADGNVVVVGVTSSDNGIATTDALQGMPSNSTNNTFVVKLDSRGQRLWGTYFGFGAYTYRVAINSTGDIFFTGQTKYGENVVISGPDVTFGGFDDVFIVRLSSGGQHVWSRYYGGEIFDGAQDIEFDRDGNFYITGRTSSPTDIAWMGFDQSHFPYTDDAFISKFDASGELIWGTYFGGESSDEGIDLVIDNNNDVYVAGLTYSLSDISSPGFENSASGYADTFIAKFTSGGQRVWSTYFGGPELESPIAIDANEYGEVYVVGLTESSSDIFFNGFDSLRTEHMLYNVRRDGFIVKFKADGNRIWASYLSDLYDPYGVAVGASGSIYVAGRWQEEHFNGTSDLFISKIDYIHGAFITGYAFEDANANCIYDEGETPLRNIVITTETDSYFSMTDSTGYYVLQVAKGDYNVKQVVPSTMDHFLTQTCPAFGSHSVSIQKNYDTLKNVNFGNELQRCASIEVDVTAAQYRACERSDVVVTFYNAGYAAAENGEIRFSLPEHVQLAPGWVFNVDADGNYVVTVGTLDPLSGGAIYFESIVDCDVELANVVQCIKAWATTSNACLRSNSLWDGSEIHVSGACIEGSAYLVVENRGSGNMTDSATYRTYIDSEFVGKGKYKLGAHEFINLQIPLQGRTLYLETHQKNHPERPVVSVVVEGCGLNESGSFTKGHALCYAPDDPELDVDVDCGVITTEIESTRKTVSPRGVYDQHYVSKGTEHEYVIHFRNMATSEVRRVTVVDSLDEDADISTLRIGGMSHYALSGEDRPVLTWTFDNSSGLGSMPSNGFVKYAVKPKENIAPRTVVENNAHIFFEGSSSIKTNTVFTSIYNIPDLGAPIIDEVDLMITSEGRQLIITGSEFNPEPGGSTVEIDGVVFEIYSATFSQLIVWIPEDLETGSLKVTTIAGSDTQDFEVADDGQVDPPDDNVTSIEKENTDRFAVYPNPAERQFIVRIMDPDVQGGEVRIQNPVGQTVYRLSLVEGQSIYKIVLDRNPGVYFLNVDLKNGSQNRKIILK